MTGGAGVGAVIINIGGVGVTVGARVGAVIISYRRSRGGRRGWSRSSKNNYRRSGGAGGASIGALNKNHRNSDPTLVAEELTYVCCCEVPVLQSEVRRVGALAEQLSSFL